MFTKKRSYVDRTLATVNKYMNVPETELRMYFDTVAGQVSRAYSDWTRYRSHDSLDDMRLGLKELQLMVDSLELRR